MTESLLFLGAGGPEDESDIGHLDRLTWRAFVIDHPSSGQLVLAFDDMRTVMAFTRALNDDAPFTVPTECWRGTIDELAEPGFTVLLNPDPTHVRQLIGEGTTTLRTTPLTQSAAVDHST